MTMLATALGVSIMWFGALGPLEQITYLPREVLILQIPIAVGLIAESTLTQISIYHQRSQRLLGIIALKSALLVVAAAMGITLRDTNKFLGVIYADAAAAIFILMVSVWVITPHVKMHFSIGILKALASYSLPLIFYTLSLAALSQIDRIFIANLLDVSQVGIYNLSYTIGAVTLMAAIPLMNAFQPRFFQAMNGKIAIQMIDDAKMLMMALTLPTIVIAFLLPSLAHFVFPLTYSSGYSSIPIIAIGAMAQIHFLIWTRVLAFHNRTSLISGLVFVAMLINCVLNLYLIPVFGIMGAAIATALAQFSMMAMLQVALYSLALPRQGCEKDLMLIAALVIVWPALSSVFPSTYSILIQAFSAIVFCALILKRLFQLVNNRGEKR